jgi:Protein of unknown function (DUF2950)
MEKGNMRRTKLNFENFCRSNLRGLATFTAALILIGCFPTRSMAQQAGQKTFSSAEEACRALFMAVQTNDEKAMLDILGPSGKQIISSGDEAEDADNRTIFVQKYQEMHRLVKEPDGTTTLYIGAENWPTPIPLVEKAGAWYFDTEAGREELLLRRIGHNELSAIRVCQELVAAEKEYYSQQHQYAQKIASDEGQHNGLYWLATGNQAESPVGPLIANASTGDGTRPSGPEPFRGYYFRVLTRQGKNASGGPADYFVDGKMTEGFAFVAYPAEYRNSGVMTFIVDKDGVVYQKDLGERSADLAKAMKEYDPDSTWKKAEEQPEQSASEPKK